MTRLLFIFLFVLNTLLPSAGYAAMLSSNTNMMMNQSSHSMMMKNHCSKMDMQNTCDDNSMSADLCKAKCASSSSVSHFTTINFDIPFVAHSNEISIKVYSIYSRSTPPELRPPLA